MEAASMSSRSLTITMVVIVRSTIMAIRLCQESIKLIQDSPSYEKDLSQSTPFSATAGAGLGEAGGAPPPRKRRPSISRITIA